MGPTVTSLVYIGLCLDWAVRAQMGPPPRPTLWAISSSVVSKGADVTLRCQGHLGSDRFQLWKDGEPREEQNASWQQADFLLRNVDDWKDARSYSCHSGQGPLLSEFSDALDLVVTGEGLKVYNHPWWKETSPERAFPKPYISVLHGSPLHTGATATISCDMLPQTSFQNYSFALLEAKSLEPLQQQRQLPKPTLWAQPGIVVSPGANISLWCSRPKLSSLGEVNFTLWKLGTHEHLQQQISGGLWTNFILPCVRPKDAGSYSCTYRENIASARASIHSDYLELVVTGEGISPKPSLSALPALVVEPGIHVTLQCRQPPQKFLSGLTFTLLKMGTSQPLQRQSPTGTSADFLLLSVREQDSGNYSCFYHRKMAPYVVSKPSEVLEIWVTDALLKPSLSVWPGQEVASGSNVMLLCQGPRWSSRFILYKEGIMNTIQDEAQFLLTHVTPKDSGNYSCSYQPGTSGNLRTQQSDPLEIRVTVPSNILLIALSCVSFLLICLLLLAFLGLQFTPIGSLHRESLRRVFCCSCLPQGACLPHHLETPTDESVYTEMARGTPREPSVPMAEDP
ncbi:leukocyte immunoglobulin-like receptor subfamily A member 3 [Notamacropus eugenii]|uniref:leukocyte immunoglobulin-like receptor subfamily A member 3 n=1 Tax=Notamacropus eugenii TaxID=9315 RepID=UPI003B673B23